MLESIEIQNFTCFPEARLDFSRGLNIIVGENGTGKSHLLKLGYAALYAAAQTSLDDGQDDKTVRLRAALNGVFKSTSINKLFSFRNNGNYECSVRVRADSSQVDFSFNFDKQILNNTLNTFNLSNIEIYKEQIRPIFIPAKEILSIYTGLSYEIENKLLAFDETYLHLAKALSAGEVKGEAFERIKQYVLQIEKIINAVCVKHDDKFFLVPFTIEQLQQKRRVTEYPEVEAHLAAEGDRKIGLLAYLLCNDTLRPGASLFWDEPEANLNPKLVKKLAEVLVELSNVMQITLATHSLFLLRELEILQEQNKNFNIRYFGLHFTGSGGVSIEQGDSIDDIGNITALDESIMQSNRYMEISYEE